MVAMRDPWEQKRRNEDLVSYLSALLIAHRYDEIDRTEVRGAQLWVIWRDGWEQALNCQSILPENHKVKSG